MFSSLPFTLLTIENCSSSYILWTLCLWTHHRKLLHIPVLDTILLFFHHKNFTMKFLFQQISSPYNRAPRAPLFISPLELGKFGASSTMIMYTPLLRLGKILSLGHIFSELRSLVLEFQNPTSLVQI